jgi:Cytochrome oxidase complex assembly protein 1
VDQPPTQPATQKPNWWTRNWKWFVPLGCLSVALLLLVFVGSILVIVFSAMKSTDVYREALARAKADPAVIEALGSPIKDGFLVSGNTNVNGASGESNLAIPISGPKGKGTIYVSANKSLGQWNYLRRVVEVGQTHQRIDLLHTSTPASHPDFLRCKSRQKNFP